MDLKWKNRAKTLFLFVLCVLCFVLFSCKYRTKLVKGQKDWGYIKAYPTMIREIPKEKTRLDLESLTKVSRVFEYISKNKQSSSVRKKAIRHIVEGKAQGLVTTGSKTETTGKETTGSENSSETQVSKTTDKKLPEAPEAQKPVYAPDEKGENGTAASYHDLLYSTANTVLGGQALQNLYSFDKLPDGYKVYVIPVITTFDPGIVTRRNYVGQAKIIFKGNRDFRVVAVAPAGFMRIASESSEVLKQMALNLLIAGQAKSLALGARYSRLKEIYEKITQVVKRTEFQVNIHSHNEVIFRYYGTRGLKGTTYLNATTYNTEIIVIWKQKQKNGDDGNGPPPQTIKLFRAKQEPQTNKDKTIKIKMEYEAEYSYRPFYKYNGKKPKEPVKECKLNKMKNSKIEYCSNTKISLHTRKKEKGTIPGYRLDPFKKVVFSKPKLMGTDVLVRVKDLRGKLKVIIKNVKGEKIGSATSEAKASYVKVELENDKLKKVKKLFVHLILKNMKNRIYDYKIEEIKLKETKKAITKIVNASAVFTQKYLLIMAKYSFTGNNRTFYLNGKKVEDSQIVERNESEEDQKGTILIRINEETDKTIKERTLILTIKEGNNNNTIEIKARR